MALKKTRAAVASCPEAEAAAEELLRKGNAIDAVVAGVFAACAVKSDVLLGPVQLLVGGAGAGLRAIDGRVRQPGIGAPRPRGFQPEDAIPVAARVGVPWLPATLSVASATSGSATFGQVLGPSLALAKGSPRGDVLSQIASRGPRALEDRPLASELLAVAGRPNEGLLTSEDLSSIRPEVVTARRVELPIPTARTNSENEASQAPTEFTRVRENGSIVSRRRSGSSPTRSVVTLPWAEIDAGIPTKDVDPSTARTVLAVDRYGMFAAAVWAEGHEGLEIPELGLRAPFFAEPVRRGVTRERPGDVRPAAAPVALVGQPLGLEMAMGAFGARDAYDVLRSLIGAFVNDEPLEAKGDSTWFATSSYDGAASISR